MESPAALNYGIEQRGKITEPTLQPASSKASFNLCLEILRSITTKGLLVSNNWQFRVIVGFATCHSVRAILQTYSYALEELNSPVAYKQGISSGMLVTDMPKQVIAILGISYASIASDEHFCSSMSAYMFNEAPIKPTTSQTLLD